jgi:putative FmdB family regulatory protein
MPTYEYACEACGHQWELVQRITEAPATKCPNCGQEKAHRLISRGTNFILKGGGWYSDLYASPKEAPKDTANAAPASSDDTKSKSEGTKSETKTEPKAAASSSESSTPAASSPPSASSS